MEFSLLDYNWDGYEAEAPDQRSIRNANSICRNLIYNGIDVGLLYPLRSGGIQIEYNKGNFEYEIEVQPDGSVKVLKYQGSILIDEKDFKQNQFENIIHEL